MKIKKKRQGFEKHPCSTKGWVVLQGNLFNFIERPANR